VVNPYKSPEQSLPNETSFVPRLWSVYYRLCASIFTTVVVGYAIFWAWRFLGHDNSLTSIELRMWLLLVFGVVLVCFSWPPLRRKCSNAASVSRYTYGIAGTLILASTLGIFVEKWMAWYSGVTYVSVGYAGSSWFTIVTTGFLPIFICLHGVARRRWMIVPSIVFVSFVVVATLRMHFFLNHTNAVPSSWSMFSGF